LRVVIAAASNGGGYANIFRDKEPLEGPKLLESVLDELWDFDTRISSTGGPNSQPAPDDFLQARGTLLRGYNQNGLNPQTEAFFKASLISGRWQNYYDDTNDGLNPPSEIPPLPRNPPNDSAAPDDAPPDTNLTHHLIRDFMFLDAAAHNDTSKTPNTVRADLQAQKNQFLVVRKDFDFSNSSEQTLVSKFTRGPGRHPVNKLLLDDASFVDPGGTSRLNFESKDVAFTALLYELQEKDNPGVAAKVVPNWFGVAVPDGITDFRNIIIYFHPSPGQAGYQQADYQSKTGNLKPPPPNNGTNWKELYAYIDRLGNQLAGAALIEEKAKNQILIFPFMRDFRQVGILPKWWYHIVRDIIDDIIKNGV
jgi:hypothetical protein